MPSAFCHPLPNEIVHGTIYGVVISLALIRRNLSMWQSVAWLGMVVLAGNWVIVACDGLIANDPVVPANQVFVLGLFVGMCRLAANLNRRFDDWNQAEPDPSAGQFGIGGLLWLTTVVAILLLVVKQTTLIDRGMIYWFGLFALVVIFAFAFSRHPFALVVVAGVLAIGLAMLDAYVVQPDTLDFASAMPRYAGLLFGMIAPRLGLSLCGSIVSCYHNASPQPSPSDANRPCRSEGEVESMNLASENDDVSPKIKDANVGSHDVGIDPTPQAQPALRIIC